MKCSICGKEKSIWTELVAMPLTSEQKMYPRLPAKPLVCHTCLGWDVKPKNHGRRENIIIKKIHLKDFIS
jgi:hypothetical protein